MFTELRHSRTQASSQREWDVGQGWGSSGSSCPSACQRDKERKDIPTLEFLLLAPSAGKLLAYVCLQHSQGWEEAQILQILREMWLQSSFLRSSPFATTGRYLRTKIIIFHRNSPSQSPFLITRKNWVIPREGRAGKGVLWTGVQEMPLSLSTPVVMIPFLPYFWGLGCAPCHVIIDMNLPNCAIAWVQWSLRI